MSAKGNAKPIYFLIWIRGLILINLICFIIICFLAPLVLGSQKKSEQEEDPSKVCSFTLLDDIYFFVYAFISTFVEFLCIREVSIIMASSKIVNCFSFGTVYLLCISFLGKYDLYTDTTFFADLYYCKEDLLIYSFISIAVTTINFLISIYGIVYNYYIMIWSKSMERKSSTFYINIYTQLTFLSEMHSFGYLFDRFSTSSAIRITSRLLPIKFRGIYYPSIVYTKFQKVFMEDIPQIIIQILVYVELNQLDNLRVIVSTILNLFNSLKHAWDARPSVFTVKIFMDNYNSLRSKYPSTARRTTAMSPVAKQSNGKTPNLSNFKLMIMGENMKSDSTDDYEQKTEAESVDLENSKRKLVLKKFGVNLDEGFALGIGNSKAKGKLLSTIRDHILKKGEESGDHAIGRRQLDLLMQDDIQNELNEQNDIDPEIMMMSTVGLYNEDHLKYEAKRDQSSKEQILKGSSNIQSNVENDKFTALGKYKKQVMNVIPKKPGL